MTTSSPWRPWLWAGLGVGVVLGALISVGLVRAGPSLRPVALAERRGVTPRGPLDPEERSSIALFRSASASVAFITTQTRRIDFWTRNILEVPQGTGSGFVWDEDGHVVTNFHVVQDATSAEVTLGETAYQATLVGTAPDHDLAVLKIGAPREKLVPIHIGTSADTQVVLTVFPISTPS